MRKEGRLDIFDVLAAIDQREFDWLAQQVPEKRGQFQPLVVTRWAATMPDGPQAAYALWIINERVNLHLFDLATHPELVFRLLASCGTGKRARHTYLAGKSRASGDNKAVELIRDLHPDANQREAEMLLATHSRPSFLDLAQQVGAAPKDLEELLNHYDRFLAKDTAQATNEEG